MSIYIPATPSQVVDAYLSRLNRRIDTLNNALSYEDPSLVDPSLIERFNAAASVLELLEESLDDWKRGLPNPEFDQLSGLDNTPFKDPDLVGKISDARNNGDLFVNHNGEIIPVFPILTICEPAEAISKNEVRKIELVGVVDGEHVFKETAPDGSICYVVRTYIQPKFLRLPILPTGFKRIATEEEVLRAKENAIN